jgi:hypothetical protein
MDDSTPITPLRKHVSILWKGFLIEMLSLDMNEVRRLLPTYPKMPFLDLRQTRLVM